MRTFRFSLLMAVLVSLFSACKNDAEVVLDDYGKPEDTKTYTIMMYGCGGGNLDECMMQNIDEAFYFGATDRVNFTAQVNFSKKYQDNPELKNTQRFIVPNTPDTDPDPESMFDSLLDLSDPKNLTEFIRWSKEQRPADEYILLLWNHGGGWMPVHDDPEGYKQSLEQNKKDEEEQPNTRAICYDDNFGNRALTLNNLVKGIKDSNTKFKMIYFDACLMGTMEVITGVSECADYFMGASHITPGIGGDYNSLMYHLGSKTNFEDSMKEYCRETMAHWNVLDQPYDLKVINLTKLDIYLKEINMFAKYLNEVAEISCKYMEDMNNGTYDPADSIEVERVAYMMNNAVNKCYKYSGPNEGPFYDLNYLAEYFTSYPLYNPYSAKFVDVSSRMNRAWNQVVVCNETSRIARQLDLSVAVTMVYAQDWQDMGYEKTYEKLEFHKATAWGDWLSDNPIEPKNNPNPSIFQSGGQQQPENGEQQPENGEQQPENGEQGENEGNTEGEDTNGEEDAQNAAA